MDFTTNYCGMYWSDGRVQPSVLNGSSQPVSALDTQCQLHDSAYARAISNTELDVADTNFYNNTNKLGFRGKLYGNLVYYGNKILRMGNALDSSTKNGPELRKHLRWVQGNNKVLPDIPAGGGLTPGDNAPPIPGLEPTTYDGTNSEESNSFPSTSYSATGFESGPFTTSGLYKPLGRKRKRKRQKRTDQEYYQLLSALSRVKPSLQK